MISFDVYESPIGKLYIVCSDKGLYRIEMFDETWKDYLKEKPHIEKNEGICQEAITQLDEYFRGKRKHFSLPLDLEGTPFRLKVWEALSQIPYGKTVSYQDIALTIGNKKSVRAVGGANRSNPIPLIIPCHRVIGKNGNLVGYAGSHTDKKAWLLAHERRVLEEND